MNTARLVAVAAGVTVMLAPAGAVGADPPGPTDYETVVVGIEPATPTIAVEMIGGDSFVQLAVQRGIEAVVLGYSDEPYLRFRTDGTVEENRLSPAVAQNKDRYGEASSATGDPNATPEWVVVANNGTYAWHDHRAHWMSSDPPPGFERGQRIQDGVIPLVVDGVTVRISVTTTWQEAPSRVPLVAGAIVAGFVVMTVLSIARPARLGARRRCRRSRRDRLGAGQFGAGVDGSIDHLVAAPCGGRCVGGDRRATRPVGRVLLARAARRDRARTVGVHATGRPHAVAAPDRCTVLARPSGHDGGRRRGRRRRRDRGGGHVPAACSRVTEPDEMERLFRVL